MAGVAHIVTIAAIIVGCWIILALVVTLALGRWLQRASRVPTGPTTYERARSVVRGAGRLLLLPYVVESSAREQARRRARRSRVAQRRDTAAVPEPEAFPDVEPERPAPTVSGKETG